MSYIVAEYARLTQRIARKGYLREQKCKHGGKRRDKEGKAEHAAFFRHDSERNKEKIDIAKLQGQLVEPVEALKPRYLQKLRVYGQKALIYEVKHDVQRADDDENALARSLRLIAQSVPYEHQRCRAEEHQENVNDVKGIYLHRQLPFCI